MTSSDKPQFKDEFVTRYLLGNLPPEETERLDELSVVDEEFAWRLNALEDDLVDNYVAGHLSKHDRERFQSFYLSSPARREKLRFAETFLSRLAPAPESPKFFPRLQWAFVALTFVLLGACGYLYYTNLLMQKQQVGLREQATSAEKQLADARAAMAKPSTVAFLLMPPLRGSGTMPSIVIPPGTGQLEIQLKLESDDFPAYRVVLHNAAGQSVWNSETLQAQSGTQGQARPRDKIVAIALPISIVKQQTYTLDLSGIPAHGAADLLGSYPMSLVIPR